MKKMIFRLFLAAMIITISTSAHAGYLVIKGSTTVLPVAQKVAEAFSKDYPDISVSVSGGGSGNGIKAIVDGTTDIADSSRFIKDKELKLAISRDVYPVPFAVCYDCIVPVVHPENPISNLTVDQLKSIYKGEIDNWRQLGGDNRKIVMISRDSSSGTYEVWEEKIMEKERVHPSALLQASNGAIVQAVSKNKNAIGYIGLGSVDSSVKSVSVNGIAGSEETALDGTYFISRPLFMFTNGWPKEGEDGDVSKFIKYMLNPEKGQQIVRETGFIPLY
jgi:phosphate transport system substrate-binding protein